MQDAQQQERDRPGEVEGPRRIGEDLARVTQVTLDVVAGPLGSAGEQRAGVRQHQGIVVGVHDPGVRCHLLGHLVGIARCRQPGADVQELPDARLAGQVPDRPPQEGPVRPGLGHDARQHRRNLVASLPVGRVVVRAAQPVIPDPRRMRHRRVQPGARIGRSSRVVRHRTSSPGHTVCPELIRPRAGRR